MGSWRLEVLKCEFLISNFPLLTLNVPRETTPESLVITKKSDFKNKKIRSNRFRFITLFKISIKFYPHSKPTTEN